MKTKKCWVCSVLLKRVDDNTIYPIVSATPHPGSYIYIQQCCYAWQLCQHKISSSSVSTFIFLQVCFIAHALSCLSLTHFFDTAIADAYGDSHRYSINRTIDDRRVSCLHFV